MSIECPFLFEIERKTETHEVEKKIQKYAGYWLRRYRKFDEVLMRPIIIVHHDTRPAKRRREFAGAYAMCKKLRDRLYSGGHFAELQKELLRRDEYADIGRMILLCEWRDAYAGDPLGSIYYPVGQYDEGVGVEDKGWTVNLEAAARERAETLRAFAKKAA